MPVVPRIDSPPTMPSRPLRVLAASASPPGMAISISTSPASPCARRDLRDGLAQHLARHGIDGRLAGRNGKAGPRHHADAFAGTEAHAASGRGAANRGEDQRAVGDVGIVAGVLDHAGRRRAIAHRCGGEREGRMLPARQGHLDRIGKFPGQKRRDRPPWRPPWRRCRWSSHSGAGGLPLPCPSL